MSGLVKDMHGRTIEEATSLVSTQWFKQVCPKLVRTATRAFDYKEAHIYMENAVEELCKKVDDISCTSNQAIQVKGLKRRNDGMKNSRRRPKSWVEKQPKNKMKTSVTSTSQQQQDKAVELYNSIPQENGHDFHKLLMVFLGEITSLQDHLKLKDPKTVHSVKTIFGLVPSNVGLRVDNRRMSSWPALGSDRCDKPISLEKRRRIDQDVGNYRIELRLRFRSDPPAGNLRFSPLSLHVFHRSCRRRRYESALVPFSAKYIPGSGGCGGDRPLRLCT
ncbi:hypothetical protein PIB30_015518 [Stylosanthes scabra]|uniref:Uncharacterized protein n=1 Tax=Stylosanthes scabra TaxID=79078 RepID=A0ABU6Y471_9FABA|nr:hypothetical protein [Stylosanthes scabra]